MYKCRLGRARQAQGGRGYSVSRHAPESHHKPGLAEFGLIPHSQVFQYGFAIVFKRPVVSVAGRVRDVPELWRLLLSPFGIASFAGDFTVREGKRYCATLALNSVERLADNALIARKFRALGFSRVHVSGTGAMRRVEGVWHRKDASATLPRQIVAVAGL